ncbi:MAG: glucosamine-6-phosphate deaminase [Planctomycetota bacterium]
MLANRVNGKCQLVKIFEDSQEACKVVARRIENLVRERIAAGDRAVLGLATGYTPIGIYDVLVRMHKQEGLDLSNVVTFNLDEYWPIEPTRMQSYHCWMKVNFFDHVNIPPENIHIPSGTVKESEIEAHCREYERLIKETGGIDLQILGIGRSGHIGFNEPGSSCESRTRLVQLDKITRKDAANDFFGEENVPKMAITMGVGTILEAKELVLLAFGEHKANIIRQAIEGEVSNKIAASVLQEYPNVAFYLDEDAGEQLTQIATPWLVRSCQWDELLERKAVIWLARKIKKPMLRLTEEDYAEGGLDELIRTRGRAYDINLRVFRRMMKTITGWPAGKNCSKRILLLNPHPDDDVICMAGTIVRLVEQGHDVHTAYMTSGYLSVFDYNVLRHAEFVKEFNRIFGLTPEQTANIEEHIENFLRCKKPTDIDTPEIRAIKALIRRTEAVAAAKFCGIQEENIHFLNLPFYNTGTVQKASIGPKDIENVRELLEKIKPEIIFAAGDMSDPHGTHRLCLKIFLQVLEEDTANGKNRPEVWLYRGAWQEWMPEQIDMAVPLSPDELRKKRLAIFRHESQKDKAMFPGPYDEREFWQRAEQRNMETAAIYNALGLREYHAIEAFAHWPMRRSLQVTSVLSRADVNDK